MSDLLERNAPPVAPSKLPTLYMTDRTVPMRGRLWWAGVADRCGHCSPAGLLSLDAPVDLRDPGRLSCLTCGREAATVRTQRSMHGQVEVYGDMRKPPTVTADGHKVVPCGAGCGKRVEVRNKTGFCKQCLGRQPRGQRAKAGVVSQP